MPLGPDEFAPGSGFVLYWTHHALRVDENPALEVAASIARGEGLALLVYASVGATHPIRTDRHATFLIEGFRDLADRLAALGVPFACSMSPGCWPDPQLERLASRAALVVTDDFPADPFPGWISALSRRTRRPVVAVDASCVVPMNAVEGVYERAFAFRAATARERLRREGANWPVCEALRPDADSHADSEAWPAVDHDVPDVDWRRLDVAAAVAALDVDHSVGPVADTAGGEKAGLARWRAFRRDRLAAYASDRDDAALDGVSRMSAYLHFGMVPATLLAREAREDGAEKYLDELLVWRELAFHWCRHEPRHASFEALPAWARATLAEHERDARDVLPPERLERGATGDRLWDLAQASLVRHGELHNNLRMTWGKAISRWCATPADAVATAIRLNDRFALDGCDPSSYAGILWCFGLLDRPFEPATAVLGRVRSRPTQVHAARLDLDAYARRALRPGPVGRVAVIGAGVAGLACGRTLRDHGLEVVVFEKSRGPGGRTSTRRGEGGEFDHGAQYFTARDPRFRELAASWCEQGVVARWEARFGTIGASGLERIDPPVRYVGAPSMSSLCGHLAEGLELRRATRVSRIVRDGTRYALLVDEADGAPASAAHERFDLVLTTAPAAQTAALLATSAPSLATIASRISMRATWSLMLALPGELPLSIDHAEILRGTGAGEALAWISRSSSKPGRVRDGVDRWTILARPEWSEERLGSSAGEIAPVLVGVFAQLCRDLGVEPLAPVHAAAHRWRFALASAEGGPGAAFDASLGLGMAGDWLRGTRVEDAYLSGVALAGRVLGAAAARARVVRTSQ